MSTKPFPVAILQGRLSPDIDNRYQFFPKEKWQDEFRRARELNFDGIEWLIDPKQWSDNPVFGDGYMETETLMKETNVPVVSMCADWFMEICIWEGDPDEHRKNIRSLFPRLAETTNKLLLLPLLEKHDITDVSLQEKVVAVLKPLAPELESYGIQIGFETELSASALITFLDMFESSTFGVYYDVGNCTSYGFDCPEDIRTLGKRIKGIHLKDRKLGTNKSLMLGTGDVRFGGICAALTEIDWEGTLVMQAWRGENYIEDAKVQLAFVRSFFT